MMIPHHRQALEMAKLATTRAADPEVEELAARIGTEQEPEIRTMTMAKTELDRGKNPAAKALAESIVATQTAEIAEMHHLLATLN
jgi:uncharacterized protein (DUF305 family)